MSQQRSRSPNLPVGGRTTGRRTASRREREQRRQRIAIGTAIGGMVLVALIIAVPLLKRNLWDPSRTLATVGEQRISRADYDKRQRLGNFLGIDTTQPQQTVSQLSQTFEVYRRNPGQFRDSLKSQAATLGDTGAGEVSATGLDPMVNDAVLVEAAPQAGVDLSEASVDRKVTEYLYPAGAPKEPSAGATAVPTPTQAAGAPAGPTQSPGATAPPVTPTAGPPSDRQVDGFFDALDDGIGVSRGDFERLVVEPLMVREGYADKHTPKSAPQVHVRHILVKERAQAEKVLQDLRKGVKFEVIARERSLDTSNAPKGGDLGWAPREAYVKPFSNAAFALTKPGQLSPPVQTSFGWHIIQLLERDNDRPLTQQQQEQVAQSRLQDFLQAQRARLKQEDRLDIAIPPTPAPTAAPTASPAAP
jgi:hypothetical protein